MTPDVKYLHALVMDGLPRWFHPGPELERIKIADALGWLDVSYGQGKAKTLDTYGMAGPALVRGLTPAGRRLLVARGLV